jgi:hypothetical protein
MIRGTASRRRTSPEKTARPGSPHPAGTVSAGRCHTACPRLLAVSTHTPVVAPTTGEKQKPPPQLPQVGTNRRAGDVGLVGRGGGRRHDRGGRGRRCGDGARSWPWTARYVACRTHAQALMHTNALDAGVGGARVAVVAPARAGTRSDARRKVCRARAAVVLGRSGAPAEAAGLVGRGPAAPDAGSCPGQDALRACCEVPAATVQEGASTRPCGRERRARSEAVVMGARASIRGATELVHAVAFAGPQARRRDGRATVLLAGERGHPRRLKTSLFLESASGATVPSRSGRHDREDCTQGQTERGRLDRTNLQGCHGNSPLCSTTAGLRTAAGPSKIRVGAGRRPLSTRDALHAGRRAAHATPGSNTPSRGK